MRNLRIRMVELFMVDTRAATSFEILIIMCAYGNGLQDLIFHS